MRILYGTGIALFMAMVLVSSGQIGENNSTRIVCSNLKDCYNQGMELLSQGNCSEAYDALQSAITYNKSNSDAWVGEGKAAACMGNFSEAIKCCEAAIVWDKENAQAYAVMAEVLLAQNRTDEARNMIEDAVEKNISNPELWIECGKVFSRMEMWQDAQKCFNRATDLDPKNAEGWYLEADALQKLGRFEDAILVYNNTVININPYNKDAWMGRSQTLEALKLYAEAEKSYSKVLDLNPTNEEALFRKGLMLLLLKRNDEALEALTNLTERAPNNAVAWMREGLALAKLGKCNESLAAYDSAIAQDANSSDALIGRGDAQLCLGWVNQAQETYETVLRMDKRNGPAKERMSHVLFLNGQYNAARTYAEQSIGEDMMPAANYARAWFTYANALNATHQHGDAIEQYLIAAKRMSSTSQLDPQIDLREIEWAMESLYMHRAGHEYCDKIALSRSDYNHAREFFQNLTEKNESDTGAWMMLGICNLMLWQFDKSEECFQKVLNIDPTNLAAAEWIAEVRNERQPHIILVDFTNEGIEIPSVTDLSLNWKPPEKFQATLENLADVDGIADASIWTVPNDHVKRVKLATFEIPVEKNSQNTSNDIVRIPWDTFIDLPSESDIFGLIDFLRAINPVQLTCEVTVKQTP
jgi:tetratricopeptide (TPR) repeat protein